MTVSRVCICLIAIIVSCCNDSTPNYELCGKQQDFDIGLQKKYKVPLLTDLVAGLDCANEMKRPILVVFTGHACVGYDAFRHDLLKNKKVKDYIRNDYISVVLYVDDKKQLTKDEALVRKIYAQHGVELDTNRRLKTTGHLNATVQMSIFKDNAQVLFGFLKPNGEQLIPPFHYNKKEPEFLIGKLEEGLMAWQIAD